MFRRRGTDRWASNRITEVAAAAAKRTTFGNGRYLSSKFSLKKSTVLILSQRSLPDYEHPRFSPFDQFRPKYQTNLIMGTVLFNRQWPRGSKASASWLRIANIHDAYLPYAYQMPQCADRYSPRGIQPGVAGWEARSKMARSKKPGQGRLDSRSRASSPKKAYLQGAQKTS